MGDSLPVITEREQIVRALEQANWVISGASGAAALLGMKRSTLQARSRNSGLKFEERAQAARR
jgi:formate hydrogenlyase transcriptional activator